MSQQIPTIVNVTVVAPGRDCLVESGKPKPGPVPAPVNPYYVTGPPRSAAVWGSAPVLKTPLATL